MLKCWIGIIFVGNVKTTKVANKAVSKQQPTLVPLDSRIILLPPSDNQEQPLFSGQPSDHGMLLKHCSGANKSVGLSSQLVLNLVYWNYFRGTFHTTYALSSRLLKHFEIYFSINSLEVSVLARYSLLDSTSTALPDHLIIIAETDKQAKLPGQLLMIEEADEKVDESLSSGKLSNRLALKQNQAGCVFSVSEAASSSTFTTPLAFSSPNSERLKKNKNAQSPDTDSSIGDHVDHFSGNSKSIRLDCVLSTQVSYALQIILKLPIVLQSRVRINMRLMLSVV